VTLQFAPNLSMLYNEVPFLARFALARRAGFASVEFLFPYAEGIEEIRARLDDLGLTAVLFDIHPGNLDAGELGTLGNPHRRNYFRWSLAAALKVANRLCCARLNVLAGNRVPEVDADAQIECAIENLAWAAPQAADAGVELLLEPLNPSDRPEYLVHTTVAALEMIRSVNHPSVRLQYDLYHAQMTEGNLIGTLTRWLPAIGHIQIADVPGRHQPGTGEINYPAVFAALEQLGYQGYIGLEYHPWPAGQTEASLRWLANSGRSVAIDISSVL
jgi:hydroxypyruvate isomerase